MNLLDARRIAFASERSPRTMHFIIEGNPIPLARPRMSKDGHVWDSQKAQKLIVALELQRQFKNHPLFTSALGISLLFYFDMPTRLSKKSKDSTIGKPVMKRPDTDNLIKFYLDCANDIIFTDDSIVTQIYAEKLYGDHARVEMIIGEL